MKKLLMLGLCMTFLAMSSLAFAEDVFVTKRGKKYHQETCRVIQKSKVTAIDELEAEEKGYGPCKRCFKEEGVETDAKKSEGNKTRKDAKVDTKKRYS